MKLDLSKYTKEKKTTAKLRPGEMKLGGDSKYINEKRKMENPKKKTFIQKLFS